MVGSTSEDRMWGSGQGLVVWLLALYPYFLRSHVTNSCPWREPAGAGGRGRSPLATRMCWSLLLRRLARDCAYIVSSVIFVQLGRGMGPYPSSSPVHPQDLTCTWNVAGANSTC